MQSVIPRLDVQIVSVPNINFQRLQAKNLGQRKARLPTSATGPREPI